MEARQWSLKAVQLGLLDKKPTVYIEDNQGVGELINPHDTTSYLAGYIDGAFDQYEHGLGYTTSIIEAALAKVAA